MTELEERKKPISSLHRVLLIEAECRSWETCNQELLESHKEADELLKSMGEAVIYDAHTLKKD